jgi:nucleotidyltransferase/DNA polymerase involved in DNA repair
MTKKNQKSESIKDLQILQNIGPATAEKLYSVGIRTSGELKRSDPKKLYERLKKKSGGKLDRCVLYQLRGAIQDISWPECKDLPED